MTKHKQHRTKFTISTTAVVLAIFGITGLTVPAYAKDGEVEINVNVDNMLSLAIYPVGDHTTEADQVILNPIPNAGLATNMLDLVVRTNVETGYQLMIEDKDTSTDLAKTDDITKTIPTLSTDTDTDNFPSNRWGYSVGAYDASSSEFHGVPAFGSPAVITRSNSLLPGDGETTTITFGVKVDDSVADGIYEDVVVFTVSPELAPTEPEEPEDITDLKEMQDMTSAICAKTPTPSVSDTVVPEATLTDSRDGKTYKVRKLADGKCWMVQELNFVLSTTKTLTPNDTDITSDWTPDNNTQTTSGTQWAYISPTTARSYTNGTRTYYNWYAATGGTTNASTTSGDAPGSVCPKGWTLPSSGDFVNLITTTYNIPNSSAGYIKLHSAPLEFEYTGYYIYASGTFDRRSSDGFLWSGSVVSAEYARYLRFASGLVQPQSNDNRADGLAVRCVAK